MRTDKDIKDIQPTPLQEEELQSAPLGETEQPDNFSGTTETLWDAEADKARKLPSAFHISRNFEQNRGEYERTIFDSLLSKKDLALRQSEPGAILIEQPKGVSPVMLKRLNLALAQELYNTSYNNGTTEQNTGLIKNNTLQDGTIIEPYKGRYSYAQVIFPLTGITAQAYGLKKGEKPTNAQKNEMRETLQSVHNSGVNITYPNGDTMRQSLLLINSIYRRAKDGAIFYNVVLNPAFREELEKGYSEHPQDVMQRLAATGQITEAKLDFLNLLGRYYRSGGVFERYKSTLLQELGLMELYRKYKKRADDKLRALFQTMIDIKLLSPTSPDGGANPKETTAPNGEIKYIFYYDPEYIKKDKLIGDEQPTPKRRKRKSYKR